MIRPTYFVNGAHIFPQQGRIYAFGFGVSKENISYAGFGNLAAESQLASSSEAQDLNPNTNKKHLQSYKINEDEWSEIQEGMFTGQRKRSLEETQDEAF